MSSLHRFSESLPMLLLRARETVMARFRPILHRNGVTEQQWRVLRVLIDNGEMTASGLARECVILAPSMMRILRKLGNDGLVSVRRSSDDQRELRVSIAEPGLKLVDAIAPDIEQAYARIRERLPPEALQRQSEELVRLIALGDQDRN